jgi:hypothetical protein
MSWQRQRNFIKAVLLRCLEDNGGSRFHFAASLLHERILRLVFHGVKAAQFAGKRFLMFCISRCQVDRARFVHTLF